MVMFPNKEEPLYGDLRVEVEVVQWADNHLTWVSSAIDGVVKEFKVLSGKVGLYGVRSTSASIGSSGVERDGKQRGRLLAGSGHVEISEICSSGLDARWTLVPCLVQREQGLDRDDAVLMEPRSTPVHPHLLTWRSRNL